MKEKVSHGLVLVALTAFLATSATEAWAKVIRVRIDSVVFEPVTVEAAAGDIIEWSNDDFLDHTATARGGQFDVTIPAGTTRQILLGKPGSYDYYCRFHPNMTGRINALRRRGA
jgi:plastocyanin